MVRIDSEEHELIRTDIERGEMGNILGSLLSAALSAISAVWLSSQGMLLVQRGAPLAVDGIITFGAACAGVLLGAWYCLGFLATWQAQRTQSLGVAILVQRFGPPLLRHSAGIALGLTLSAGGAVAAVASDENIPAPAAVEPAQQAWDVGWQPAQDPHATGLPTGQIDQPQEAADDAAFEVSEERPQQVPSPQATDHQLRDEITPPAAESGARAYTIKPADSLWKIAADQLAAHQQTAANISHYWRQIYQANRSVVGADPHIIHPGVTLTIPAFTDPTHNED